MDTKEQDHLLSLQMLASQCPRAVTTGKKQGLRAVLPSLWPTAHRGVLLALFITRARAPQDVLPFLSSLGQPLATL